MGNIINKKFRSEILIRSPKNKEELEKYLYFRWEVLRKPLGMSFDSNTDGNEEIAEHAVVYQENKIIGCGRLHYENGVGQIRYMAVKENYRNLGLGAKILGYLEAIAREKSLKKIFLNARNNAINLYLRNGYKPIQKYMSPTKIPHTRMEKVL
jgi:N-acetylglutamate synthase-like GNAT family acetyltransferase